MNSGAVREIWVEAIMLALEDVDKQPHFSKEYKNIQVAHNRTSAVRWLRSRDFATVCDCLGYEAKQIRKIAFK
jgi:hypothetical protein